MTKAGFVILVSIALMAPVVVALARREGPSASERQVISDQFVESANCRPEPGERVAFLVATLGLPSLIFSLSMAWRRERPRTRADDVSGLVLTGAALGVCLFGLRGEENYHLRINEFFRHPTPSVVGMVASGLLIWWGSRGGRVVRVGSHFVAAVCIVAMALLRVFDERSSYVWVRSPFTWADHFSAVYHPVVQVALGKTILVDQASQYGLYPHFLAPIFAATGPGVLAFTTVMAALVALVLALIWAFLAGSTANRAVALIGFLALVANGSFVLVTMKDVYFQYMPIRMVFPAASVWLGWRYVRRPSRRLYWATMTILGAGVLWNLDAGLPALVSWLGMLCYRESGRDEAASSPNPNGPRPGATGGLPTSARQRRGTGGQATSGTPIQGPLGRTGGSRRLMRMAGHLGSGAMAVGLWVLAYSAFALARTGHLPDFGAFFAYQKMFYVAGFYMLPMPPVGGWWAVALIDLAALTYAARAWATGRITPRSSALFQLAILGIGLFAYYQGRSHRSVLTLAWWPSLLILTLFLDDLLAVPKASPGRLPRLAWTAALIWFLAGSARSLASFPRLLPGWYAEHLLAALKPGPSPIASELDRLRSATQAGERLLILSRQEAVFNARMHQPSAWRSSLAEAILVEDFRVMARRIGRGEFDRIYIDRSILDGAHPKHPGLAELDGLIWRGEVESTARGFLVRPTRVPSASPAQASLPSTGVPSPALRSD